MDGVFGEGNKAGESKGASGPVEKQEQENRGKSEEKWGWCHLSSALLTCPFLSSL